MPTRECPITGEDLECGWIPCEICEDFINATKTEEDED